MPQRETIAYILLILSLLWIFWMDIRPSARRWIVSRRTHPLTIVDANHPRIHKTILHCKDRPEGDCVFVYLQKICVRNDTERTLRRLVLEGQYGQDVYKVPTEYQNSLQTDLRPGAAINFRVGQVFSLEDREVWLFGHEEVSEECFNEKRTIAKSDMFMLVNAEGPHTAIPIHLASQLAPEFYYQFSADDMKPLKMILKLMPHEEHGAVLEATVVQSFADEIERFSTKKQSEPESSDSLKAKNQLETPQPSSGTEQKAQP